MPSLTNVISHKAASQDKSESIYSPSSHRTLQSILLMIVVVVVVVVVEVVNQCPKLGSWSNNLCEVRLRPLL